ncbi:putative TIM-barrel enzyme [Rhodoplanes tepidamans]|uniref:Phosphoenolpyruvate hydrolase family protein n=2 Tax=Rhodoplanes TaxID=29407 RepID=A0ABT5JIN9_RHOTP|nr:phosphoenolpyruvate hydrolase family protein [Rhodoplanes tepidamans]MDC7789368.1 phosphoenolpyruvate hydrolase family protein [Rhodoplanes tepidamans]MDQ0358473.1 putative TIM-barrel enzyme [Rhodoplanes tepidamans]
MTHEIGDACGDLVAAQPAATGHIVDRIPARRDGLLIVCPHFAGLRAGAADLVGCLPIGDANGATLALAGAFPDDPGIHAAIFAADPFRPAPVLLTALRDAGIRAVVNLPTVATVAGGLARALGHAGVDYAAELAVLAEAGRRGLDVLAVVTTGEQGRQAVAAGLRRVLVYPVAAAGDPAEGERRAAAALDAVRAVRAAAPATEILAFRHPDHGARIAPLLAAADGVVDWAVDRAAASRDAPAQPAGR